MYPNVIGPVVWYQDFEYAISHWLQKAAEHVYGCVLCSPGCFSLFRGSSLMDDNVMRRYVVKADSPAEHVQYDQGTDSHSVVDYIDYILLYVWRLRTYTVGNHPVKRQCLKM